jgi:hypothetical protein
MSTRGLKERRDLRGVGPLLRGSRVSARLDVSLQQQSTPLYRKRIHHISPTSSIVNTTPSRAAE